MRKLWFLVPALLTSVLLHAQTPAATKAKPAPKPRVVIAGTILDRNSQQPLGRVNVSLQHDHSAIEEKDEEDHNAPEAVTTDDKGHFEFKDLVPGKYFITAKRRGYAPQQYGSKNPFSQGVPVTLSPGQELRDLTMSLLPAGVVTGRIVDDNGEPVEGAVVTVMKTFFFDGKNRIAPIKMGTTNDLGEFRVPGLPNGAYYIGVMPAGSGYAAYTDAAEITSQNGSYAMTYYPGTTDAGQASTVELRAGEESRIDLMLAALRTFTVSGTVTGLPARKAPVKDDDEEGGKGYYAYAVLVPREMEAFNPSAMKNASVEENGSFTFKDVPAGQYMLTVASHSENGASNGRMQVDVNGDVRNLQVGLRAGLKIKGKVRYEMASTASTATSKKNSGGMVRLESGGSIADLMSGQMAPAFVKENGEFELENVFDGQYRVDYTGPKEGYIKSARFGGRDVLAGGLNVTSSSEGTLEIVVSDAVGKLVVSVTDPSGKPAAGAFVYAHSLSAMPSRNPMLNIGTTDQNGQLTMLHMTPGSYKIFAWPDIEPGQHMDPNFRKLIEASSPEVKVAERGEHSVQIKLQDKLASN